MNNQDHNQPHDAEPFGPVIYSYTRAQAVADGVQVEVTKTATEAGIKFPVFLTRTVFDAYVAVPPDVTGQDEAGRLWDIVWMLRFAILRSRPGADLRQAKLRRVCGTVPDLAPTGGTQNEEQGAGGIGAAELGEATAGEESQDRSAAQLWNTPPDCGVGGAAPS